MSDQWITHYATDVSSWKPWQRECFYGGLAIIPPDPPLSQVNALRARYELPESAALDAHISLTVPLPRAMDKSGWEELQSLAASIRPFSIHYGPLRNFRSSPVVYLAIEPKAELDRVRAALEAASAFAGTPAAKHAFAPHMTIAALISVERTRTIMAELAGMALEGDFLCANVSYVVPDNQFRFSERARLALGG